MSEALKNRDYYLLIDKSGSMQETDTPSGQSRFDYARESTEAIAKMLEQYDPDGITVIPFSGSHRVYPNTTAAKVKDIFQENQPMGGTMLALPLQACFDDYLANKAAGKAKANGAIVVVVTDGRPADVGQVEETIAKFTHKLDNGDGEFGIAFLQVGKDAAATTYLQGLDDNIKGAKFDIVDTKTIDQIEQIGLTEALVAALND